MIFTEFECISNLHLKCVQKKSKKKYIKGVKKFLLKQDGRIFIGNRGRFNYKRSKSLIINNKNIYINKSYDFDRDAAAVSIVYCLSSIKQNVFFGSSCTLSSGYGNKLFAGWWININLQSNKKDLNNINAGDMNMSYFNNSKFDNTSMKYWY